MRIAADSATIVVRPFASAGNVAASREVLIGLLGVVRSPIDHWPHDRQFGETANSFAGSFSPPEPPGYNSTNVSSTRINNYWLTCSWGIASRNEELVHAAFCGSPRRREIRSRSPAARAAEDEARRRGRGLWANKPSDPPSAESPVREGVDGSTPGQIGSLFCQSSLDFARGAGLAIFLSHIARPRQCRECIHPMKGIRLFPSSFDSVAVLTHARQDCGGLCETAYGVGVAGERPAGGLQSCGFETQHGLRSTSGDHGGSTARPK